VTGDKGAVSASEGIDINHHAGGTVHNVEEVAQKLLCPAAHLVDGAVVLKDFLHTTTVTKPVKFCTPQVLSVLADCPTANGGFPDKRMVVLLLVSASARAKTDGSETSPLQGEVEFAFARALEMK
jgi:hypothetical protein